MYICTLPTPDDTHHKQRCTHTSKEGMYILQGKVQKPSVVTQICMQMAQKLVSSGKHQACKHKTPSSPHQTSQHSIYCVMRIVITWCAITKRLRRVRRSYSFLAAYAFQRRKCRQLQVLRNLLEGSARPASSGSQRQRQPLRIRLPRDLHQQPLLLSLPQLLGATCSWATVRMTGTPYRP